MYKIKIEYTGTLKSARVWQDERGDWLNVLEFEDDDGVRLSLYVDAKRLTHVPYLGSYCRVKADHVSFIRPAHIMSKPDVFTLRTLTKP